MRIGAAGKKPASGAKSASRTASSVRRNTKNEGNQPLRTAAFGKQMGWARGWAAECKAQPRENLSECYCGARSFLRLRKCGATARQLAADVVATLFTAVF